MTMRLVLCLTLAYLLGLTATAAAQAPATNPPVTAVRLVITGGVSPVTTDLPISGITGPSACVSAASGTAHNPSAFDYKVNSTDTTCFHYADPGSGPLLSLPIGGVTYTATLAYVNSQGAGPASAVSNPFDHPGAPPAVAPAAVVVH